MKRILLLIMMVFLLAACGNGDDTTEESAEETDPNGESENGESTSGDQPGESSDEESTVETSDIINEAVSAWGDASSYEARQTFTIKSGDTQNVVRTITTQSEQDEVKIEVDNGKNVLTHYLLGGDHFIYQNNNIEQQEETTDISGNTYSDIISQLEAFEAGTSTETEDGYEIEYPVESLEETSAFLDQETISLLDEAENVNGLITINLNDEYQYVGGELTLTVETQDEEVNLVSNIEYSRIGGIDIIEKPKNM